MRPLASPKKRPRRATPKRGVDRAGRSHISRDGGAKISYFSQEEALGVLAGRGKPGRAYECPECRFWHLSMRERP